MATFSEIKKNVLNYINPYIHPSIKEGLYRINLKSTRDISFAFTIMELLALISYFIFFRDVLSEPGVIPNALYSIGVSAITFLISNYGLKDSKHPFSTYRHISIIYYILIIIFGIATSFYHYANGNQMFVFFAIVFCLVNFFLLPPITSFILIFGSYIVFYLILYAYDGAIRINLFNYSLLAILTVIGAFNKYRMQATELERIHRIETMNDMLQNVPVHDNVTDMKNRYALRDDFDSYQNHHIIVVMLDLDEFSKVNEEYGLDAGNAILNQVGKYIKTHLTDSHSYRYGSDSFLIILQDMELSDALQRLSIWERSMATLSIPEIDKPIHYTSGYSHGTPRDEDELRMLIEAADRKRRDYSS
ncbi:GGDEF domain-containing protein [Butyrivibrio sp. INlla16]|uniref:GGDEF domain-containing protein n=1 Tax=Butyrivibrio sp. INlla16 TaxID=1520807 RepID=UPI000891BAD8|nr:GGDEF domain-containing protein [Butyrivibrio sp. INlla16]SDB47055.1 diguanylate cyclase (GGDEF) domain-containing protein [Butyrivibrio sp. INlla16]